MYIVRLKYDSFKNIVDFYRRLGLCEQYAMRLKSTFGMYIGLVYISMY